MPEERALEIFQHSQYDFRKVSYHKQIVDYVEFTILLKLLYISLFLGCTDMFSNVKLGIT